jgi:hypothetical protein
MANGPFGNPLSTGIALSFEVDMTPYREMHKRKLLAAEEKKQQRAKQQKELQDILKNVTVDTSKIHDRYKDDAMNEYASTINDIMSMYKEGNVSGVYQRINKFNNGINSYVDATENFKAYVKSDGSKTFKDENIIRAFNDVENVSEKEFTEMAQADADYSNGVYNFIVTDRVDADAYINKLIQGVDKDVMYDPSTGQPVVAGRLAETGRVSYKTGVSNAKDIEDRTLSWFMSNGPSAVRTLMSEYGLKPGDLDSTDESGQNMLEKYARDYVSKRLTPKLYGQTEYTIPKEGGGGFSFSMGSGKSEGSIFNKSGGRELKLEGDNVLKTKGQYDVTFTKGTGRTTMSVPSGSYVLDPTTGEYKTTSFTGSLEDAIPLYPMVGEDNQEWYVAISKGEVSDVDPNKMALVMALIGSGDPQDALEAQKILDKSKYGQTYLIKGNDSVRNQFWGKILGQDYTKQRAANAMKELGKSEDRLGLGI